VSITQEEHVQWFRVFCHGRLAEVAQQSLAKGAPVYVEGPLRVREFTTREGQKRFSLELTARDMRVLSAPTPTPVSEER
jgi:single-strand DNA-binding protein